MQICGVTYFCKSFVCLFEVLHSVNNFLVTLGRLPVLSNGDKVSCSMTKYHTPVRIKPARGTGSLVPCTLSYLSCSIFISLSCTSSISGIVREWYRITGPLYTVLPVLFYIYLIILHLLYQWHSERVVPDHWSPVHCLLDTSAFLLQFETLVIL